MDKREYTKNICNFYSNLDKVWPDDNKWHTYTHNYIDKYVCKRLHFDSENPLILTNKVSPPPL